jgi:rhamnopyranosyl-N-acetylglucosaminyl-diphospho-decaprenol beta-1,3/1,4-galactofuranosyltransferase
MKIIAVVVTFNRLPLLKKCLNAISSQTLPPDNTIVINNGSTDGTASWLAQQAVVTYHQANLGGAGGFSRGISAAYEHGADWIWIMDDDTIPHLDALEKLVTALKLSNVNPASIGFLSSNILWTDHTIHRMNQTYILHDPKKIAKLAIPKNNNLPLIQFGTFVSMLLSAVAVEMFGLPIDEFFIWNDDVEYTKRIIEGGLAGLFVKDSVAVHETPINHVSNVFIDSPEQLWKYNYGLRNEMFTKRTHEGELQFWITWVHRMVIMPFRIAINRKSHRWNFTKTIWRTSLKAINFRPAIKSVTHRV